MLLNYNRGLCHTTTEFNILTENHLFSLNHVHHKFLKCVKLLLHVILPKKASKPLLRVTAILSQLSFINRWSACANNGGVPP